MEAVGGCRTCYMFHLICCQLVLPPSLGPAVPTAGTGKLSLPSQAPHARLFWHTVTQQWLSSVIWTWPLSACSQQKLLIKVSLSLSEVLLLTSHHFTFVLFFDFLGWSLLIFYLLLFTCSVMSNSLWPHELQHARLPCPSPSPGVCLHSCPLSRWYYPTISSSVAPFSSRQMGFS